MSIGGYIRRKLFWRKNKEMYAAYKEITQVNAEYSSESKKVIRQHLQNLLDHAVSTTDYYAGIDVGADLSMFPVITKQTIIDFRDKMRSKRFLDQNLHEMHTSGSTGIPFVIQQDARKRMRVIAEIKAMNDLAGYFSHEKMMYILGSTRGNTYSAKQQFLENIYRIPVGVNDQKTMKRMVDFLINKKPVAIHASASSLIPLVSYIRQKHIPPKRFHVKTIITGGEMVPEKLRSDLVDVFGAECHVAVKYSNEEMGILAQDNGSGTPYILNVANYYFEILKMDSDQPCSQGELGRIVVTDLFNYALPMIRYDTGDIGALSENDGKPVLTNLSGKKRDLIYTVNGESISGVVITNLLKNIMNVRQYQLIQETQDRYRYKIVPENDKTPTNEDILLPELCKLLGAEAKVIVEYTDEIPATNSQKRRYTVNLYRPQ